MKISTTTYVKLCMVAMFWGASFIAGRIVAQALPPVIAAASRYLVASVLLLAVAYRLEGGLPKLNKQQLQATFGLGATGIFLYNVCFFKALSMMPAGRTALFVALNPIITALAMAVFFREKIAPQRWLGIALAFIGAIVVITRGEVFAVLHNVSQVFGMGEIAMLCAASAWAAYTILGKHALKGLSPIAATCYASLWGLLLLSMGAVLELPQLQPHSFTPKVLAAILFLGLFCTVISFIWYYEGVKILGPARTAVFNNLVPVFGVSFSALILNESILPSMIIGGVLAIIGVSLTNRQINAKAVSLGQSNSPIAKT